MCGVHEFRTYEKVAGYMSSAHMKKSRVYEWNSRI